MASIEWREDFNINVRQLDQQHREMAELANRLDRAANERQARESIRRILEELIAVTRVHFDTEERLMLEYGYPEYSAHAKEHQQLMEQLHAVQRKVDAGANLVFAAGADFSRDWVMVHLLGSDKKLGEFLNRKHVY
jgi:hemerythrin